MKIEICESLCASWLKHKKRCLLVQTNWKVSPTWHTHRNKKIKDLVRDAQKIKGFNVLRGNAGPDQMIRQTECDVLGVAFRGGVPKWYAVEVAFHRQGLLYGDKNRTVNKIFSKLFRIAIVLYDYMKAGKAEIIFASPQASPSVELAVRQALEKLKIVFRYKRPGYEFRFVVGEDFKRRIFDPLTNLQDEVSDSAELFLRASQLIDLSSPAFLCAKRKLVKRMRKKKVGRLVNENIRTILQGGTLGDELITDLTDEEYSNDVFGINKSLLQRVYRTGDVRKFYYADVVRIRGKMYRLYNHWFDAQRNAVQDFLLDMDPLNCGFRQGDIK